MNRTAIFLPKNERELLVFRSDDHGGLALSSDRLKIGSCGRLLLRTWMYVSGVCRTNIRAQTLGRPRRKQVKVKLSL